MIRFFLFIWISITYIHAGAQGTSELHYRWVSDSTYEFTYSIDFPCSLWPPPGPAMQFIASSPAHSYTHQLHSSLIYSVPFGASIYTIVPELENNCSKAAYRPSLQYECYNEQIYRCFFTLPKRSDDWTFNMGFNRPTGFDNLVSHPFKDECRINNLDFPDSVARNISPMWMKRIPNVPGKLTDTLLNSPIISVCRNRDYIIDQSTTEYDGDIIRYEIPHHGIYGDTTLTQYINSFSYDYFMPSDTPPPLRIDSVTGRIFFTPVQHYLPGAMWKSWTNYYSVPIMAREYRNDTTWSGGVPTVKRKQIGAVTRWITFVVTPDSLCADSNVTFADTTYFKPTSFVKLRCDDNPFKIAFTLPMRCSSVDTNGSCFLLTDSASGDTLNITKAATICRHDDITDYILIHTDSNLTPGTYYLYIKTGNDGDAILTQCGKEMLPYMDTLLVLKEGSPPAEAFRSDSLGNMATDLEAVCRDTIMTFYTTYPVSCSSIEKSGSDFYLVDSSGTSIINVPIIKAKANNCTGGYTREITLTFSVMIEGGNYKLYLKEGTDNNSLIDACHRRWHEVISDVNVPLPEVELGADIEICSRDVVDVELMAPAGYIYKWSTGSTGQSINVSSYGTYWCQVWTNTGCVSTDTINIIEINCTGVEERKSRSELRIYPNPAKREVNIEWEGARDGSWIMELRDRQGKLIMEKSDLKGKQQILQLPPSIRDGLYHLQLRSGKESAGAKVMIKR